MSNKFTGITSAGSAIPVYDKDAHSALEQKLDKSAFSSVSGEFATVDDVVAAVSGKADTSAAVPIVDSLSSLVNNTDYVGLAADREGNFYQIVARSGEPQSAWVVTYEKDRIRRQVYSENRIGTWQSGGWQVSPDNIYFPNLGRVSEYGVYLNGGVDISPSSRFTVNGVVSATNAGITAGNSLTAANYGITASGLTAGGGPSFGIKCEPEVFSGGGLTGFTFSSQNTGFGTAKLTTAGGNQIVQMYSPKFEARNVSGAGFSIEASGAKGYDHNGNVTWDTTVAPLPNNLIGYADTKASTGDLTGNIIMTVVPKSYQGSLSAIPHTTIDAGGLTATFGAADSTPNVIVTPNGIKADFTSSHASYGYGDATVSRYSAYNDPNKIEWSLTGSVQKREIECDSGTSAITAIAGSAVGGGSTYSAGANIDITDDVISGKDWSEDIASATSGLQPSGDYYSASNPSGFLTEIPTGVMQTSGLEYDGDKISGYMGSAFKAGDELPSGVMVESAVEYNAVNEISGYNGSAIAQYGAEKQWLVHDDTLVHASNSAQYALGVNISAVAQLLGVDETVLFSDDSPGGTITLSESPLNFKEIKMTYGPQHGSQITNNFGEDTVYYNPTNRNAILFNGVFDSNATATGVNTFIEYYVSYTGCSGTTWTRTKSMFKAINATAWGGTESWLRNLKIVGIGRKQ